MRWIILLMRFFFPPRVYPDYWYKLEFTLPDNKTRMDVVMIDTVLLCGNSDDRKPNPPSGPRWLQVAQTQIQWIEQQLKEST